MKLNLQIVCFSFIKKKSENLKLLSKYIKLYLLIKFIFKLVCFSFIKKKKSENLKL